MSTFNGRHGPNVTQYLRSIDTEQESNKSNSQGDIDFGMFTNTEFFDFESGQTTDFQPQPIKTTESPSTASPADLTSATPTSATSMPDMSSSLLFQDFNFDFSNQFPISPQLAGFPESLGALPTGSPAANSTPTFPQSSTSYSPTPNTTRIGEKRKASEPANPEEASRLAAEEDKRRRNTAASARFRHKKKQREQEMERKAKESEEKITKLEATIQTLLAENKWLKNMILEKSGGSDEVGKKLDELSAKIQQAANKERIEALARKEAKVSSSSKDGFSVKEENS
ncbi:putative regulatory protein cys-3 protein [Zalerion maritima]|uniref:Regulatory protein cys-3 protein n=1 Tax=Zalerion maritima TaxID=339359 RepID=A0AAD5WVE9_9PEZI|nr:putative regulatory protein cys-3 protein [Zalerion maritima]